MKVKDKGGVIEAVTKKERPAGRRRHDFHGSR
jgi:hypothetical protein